MEATLSGSGKPGMSQESKISISAVTGTFASLSEGSGGSPEASGKARSSTGQSLPVPEPRSPSDFERVVQKLNAASISIGRDLRFQVDLQNGKSVIQVLDSETGEIIRQIPGEQVSGYLQAEGNFAIRLFDEIA